MHCVPSLAIDGRGLRLALGIHQCLQAPEPRDEIARLLVACSWLVGHGIGLDLRGEHFVQIGEIEKGRAMHGTVSDE